MVENKNFTETRTRLDKPKDEFELSQKFILEIVDFLKKDFKNLDKNGNSQIDLVEIESALKNPVFADKQAYLNKLGDRNTIHMIAGLAIDYSGPWYKAFSDSGIGKKDLDRLDILAGQMPEKMSLADDAFKLAALADFHGNVSGYNYNYEPISKNLPMHRLSADQRDFVKATMSKICTDTGIPEAEIRPQDLRNIGTRLKMLYGTIHKLYGHNESRK